MRSLLAQEGPFLDDFFALKSEFLENIAKLDENLEQFLVTNIFTNEATDQYQQKKCKNNLV